MSAQIYSSEWRARLLLGFRKNDSRTVLSARQHYGPLTVQKPFYPEPSVCHTYLLHPPGGIAPGDHLALDVFLEDSAEVLLTTPAAGKFYRCDQRSSSLNQHMHVATGASLEWLPQEAITFAGCKTEIVTRINLEPGAKFFGWDILCLGRPASGELFASGRVRQRFELWRDRQPLLLERSLYIGGSDALIKPWGMQGYTIAGTLIANHADESIVSCARKHCGIDDNIILTATLVDDLLVCRCLAANAELMRNRFIQIWSVLRPLLLKRKAVSPRIWNT